jgi:hypothetical protein
MAAGSKHLATMRCAQIGAMHLRHQAAERVGTRTLNLTGSSKRQRAVEHMTHHGRVLLAPTQPSLISVQVAVERVPIGHVLH